MKPIWIPLFVLIVVAIDMFVIYHNWGWWRGILGFWAELLSGLFFFAVANLFMFMAAFGAGYGLSRLIAADKPLIWRPGWHAKLASLRNADGVHGQISGGMFLISGFIDSAEVYYYYTDEGGEAYKPHSWRPNRDTTVYEEDREDAECFQFTTAFRDDWLYWIAIPDDRVRMDFRIPRGSLVRNYALK